MRRLFPLLALLMLLPAHVAQAKPGSRLHPPVTGQLGVIATESPAAARVGRGVLEAGGNAIDAAAATVFALNVARPQSCGVGGGGFMLYRSRTGKVRALDFRETAGAAATPAMFAGPGLHKDFTGHLTVGVPGVVAGMDAALSRYGTLKLADAVAPAEQLAREGFRVPASLEAAIRSEGDRIVKFPGTAAVFMPNGQPLAAGSTFRQPDLAATLRRIMRGGPRAFYRGTIAQRIVRDMAAPRPATGDPGQLTLADFAAYRPVWRDPIAGTYRGRLVLGVPPPTSGGVAIQEMLNILEGFDLKGAGQSSALADHLIAEAEKIAFADRGAYIGDPAFVRMPVAGLISKAYAALRRPEINTDRANTYAPGGFPAAAAAARVPAGADTNPKGSTTHVSVIDRAGNAVALTCTIEQEFGSAVMAPGTGFLLNNELTDFGDPGTANQPAPGKRPRSSMSPEMVVQGGQPVLVAGGAGGARIIMGVLLQVVNTVDFGLDLAHSVDAERLDNLGTANLNIEDARVDPAQLTALQARGHRLVREGEYGPRPRVQLAGIDRSTGRRVAVSDSRSDQGSLAERLRPPAPAASAPDRTG
ncbi:MAG: gamma-glutamyltranspeptidase / glutathione hydrolase [Solirubrobacteraceae bacterium]|nr:gamma-glutamyltranspeptidase / glutathione hydrolase [Solirubrobacteraceae bacterium]